MVGSPPHVRVIQVEEVEEVVSDRITPACAGNTPIDVLKKLEKTGSPPHVRVILCQV